MRNRWRSTDRARVRQGWQVSWEIRQGEVLGYLGKLQCCWDLAHACRSYFLPVLPGCCRERVGADALARVRFGSGVSSWTGFRRRLDAASAGWLLGCRLAGAVFEVPAGVEGDSVDAAGFAVFELATNSARARLRADPRSSASRSWILASRASARANITVPPQARGRTVCDSDQDEVRSMPV